MTTCRHHDDCDATCSHDRGNHYRETSSGRTGCLQCDIDERARAKGLLDLGPSAIAESDGYKAAVEAARLTFLRHRLIA